MFNLLSKISMPELAKQVSSLPRRVQWHRASRGSRRSCCVRCPTNPERPSASKKRSDADCNKYYSSCTGQWSSKLDSGTQFASCVALEQRTFLRDLASAPQESMSLFDQGYRPQNLLWYLVPEHARVWDSNAHEPHCKSLLTV